MRCGLLATWLLAAVLVAAPTPSVAQPLEVADAHIASASRHLREARFAAAMAVAEAGLDLLGEPAAVEARRRVARLEVLAATAQLAFGREDDARRRLDRALRNDPDLDLAASDAPPKLRRVLVAAREANAKEKSRALANARARARTRAQEARRRTVLRKRRASEAAQASPIPLGPVEAAPPGLPLPPPARRFLGLADAREALSRTLPALARDQERGAIERWEIRAGSAPPVRVEIASRRIDGRLHVLEQVRIEGTPEAELRLLSIESAGGSGMDRILYRPADGRARRLGGLRVPLLPKALPLDLEELRPPRLEDLQLVASHASDLDGERVWVIEARPAAGPRNARLELVLGEDDGRLLEWRWFQGPGTQPVKTVRTPRANASDRDDAPRSERERGVLDARRVRRDERPAHPSVFTLARLRGADAPISITDSR